jgi:hypothetical protein
MRPSSLLRRGARRARTLEGHEKILGEPLAAASALTKSRVIRSGTRISRSGTSVPEARSEDEPGMKSLNGGLVMRSLDLSPLFRSTVGFDRLDKLFDAAFREASRDLSYPPYNIAKTGENQYRISMAVAGFG